MQWGAGLRGDGGLCGAGFGVWLGRDRLTEQARGKCIIGARDVHEWGIAHAVHDAGRFECGAMAAAEVGPRLLSSREAELRIRCAEEFPSLGAVTQSSFSAICHASIPYLRSEHRAGAIRL